MQITHPDILLADSRDITATAVENAVALRSRIATAVESRSEYVGAKRLDPLFCLPGANWEASSAKKTSEAYRFLDAYHHVRGGGYEVLNRLRLWVPFFSGYHLMSLSGLPGQQPVAPTSRDHDRWLVENRPKPDHWVGLWIKCTRKIPPFLRYSPPVMMGEIGWRIEGIVVNHDTYVCQERVNILYEAGVLDWLQRLGRAPRILEIGGGYGALASALRGICRDSAYVICDLPESLMFSGLYLTLCERDDIRLIEPGDDVSAQLSRPGVALLPNYMLHMLLDQRAAFDLVLNTLSMSEMTEVQVRGYAQAIGQLIGRSGVFFEQNQDNTSVGLIDCKDHLRRHFAWRRRLDPLLVLMTQGGADLWANAKPPGLRPVAATNPRLRLLHLRRRLSRARQRLAGTPSASA